MDSVASTHKGPDLKTEIIDTKTNDAFDEWCTEYKNKHNEAEQKKQQQTNVRRAKANEMIENHVLSEADFVEWLSEPLKRFEATNKTWRLFVAKLESVMRITKRALSWSQAKRLYRGFVITAQVSWRFEHSLCGRVYDTWNIEKTVMPVGHCYHYNPSLPDEAHFEVPAPNGCDCYLGVLDGEA